MVKNAKSLGEDGKVAIRNVRRDAVDTIKKMAKEEELSEDNVKDGQVSGESRKNFEIPTGAY